MDLRIVPEPYVQEGVPTTEFAFRSYSLQFCCKGNLVNKQAKVTLRQLT